MWLDGVFYVCLFPSASLQSYGKAKALMVVLLLCDWIGLIKIIYMRSVYLSTTGKTLDLWLPFAKSYENWYVKRKCKNYFHTTRLTVPNSILVLIKRALTRVMSEFISSQSSEARCVL